MIVVWKYDLWVETRRKETAVFGIRGVKFLLGALFCCPDRIGRSLVAKNLLPE